jgi:hypothetical protein
VVAARLRCTVCHGDVTNHGKLTLQAEECNRCHEKIKQPMGVAAEACLTCHSAEIGQRSQVVTFPHEKHIAAGLDCSLCHSGVGEKRHRDFARSAEALPKLGHEFCGTCHADDAPAADGTPPEGGDCTKCHVES